MKKLTLTIIFSFIFLGVQVFSETYYVSTTGQNSYSGLSELDAWKTIQHAADMVNPGDIVIVLSGHYAGFSCERGGTVNLPVEFRANSNSVFVDSGENRDQIEIYLANYVTIKGFNVTGAERAGISILGYFNNEIIGVTVENCNVYNNGKWGIFTGYARDVKIIGNSCSGSLDEHGIYVSNSSDNPLISNNTCFDNNACGIQINADPSLDGDGIITGAIVKNNVCYGNGNAGGAAFNFASIRNALIINNIAYNNSAGGIALWDDGAGNSYGSKNNKILNNTVVQPSNSRRALNMIDGSSGNAVFNNILIHNGSRGGIEVDSSSLEGLTSENNILSRVSLDENGLSLTEWQSQYGFDLSSFNAEEFQLFVGGADFHLKTGSLAIDIGINRVEVSEDFEGDSRPDGSGTDIGADEYFYGSLSPISYIYIPHIAHDNYSTLLQLINPANTNCQLEIEIYDNDGNSVYSDAQILLPLESKTFDISSFVDSGVSGEVKIFSGISIVKEIFKNVEGGLAEFLLSSDTCDKLLFSFPDHESSITWKGISCFNTSDSTISITVKAIVNGSNVLTESYSIKGKSRLIGLLGSGGDFLKGVDFTDIGMVMIETSSTSLNGLNISGANQEKLLFTPAIEL